MWEFMKSTGEFIKVMIYLVIMIGIGWVGLASLLIASRYIAGELITAIWFFIIMFYVLNKK